MTSVDKEELSEYELQRQRNVIERNKELIRYLNLHQKDEELIESNQSEHCSDLGYQKPWKKYRKSPLPPTRFRNKSRSENRLRIGRGDMQSHRQYNSNSRQRTEFGRNHRSAKPEIEFMGQKNLLIVTMILMAASLQWYYSEKYGRKTVIRLSLISVTITLIVNLIHKLIR